MIDANEIGKHLSRLYDKIDHLQAQIYDLQNQNYVKMCEKLAINDELDTVAMLFDLGDPCAKAKEGCLFIHNDPDVVLDASKAKIKDIKNKGPAVLATEPQQKHGRDREGAPKKPLCAYHNGGCQNTEGYHEIRLLRDQGQNLRSSRNDHSTGHSGGHAGGR
ncbi:hypothetical protein D1007_00159 [Hordeum vulgare]|nr:hypothetical protein D1007_00159 [Hordeum vulgare]